MSEAKTLAQGADLTPETWADFVERLTHDCRGEGVRSHYTADAIFIVQARRYIYGIDRDYAAVVVASHDESIYTTPGEFHAEHAGDEWGKQLDQAAEEYGRPFLELSESTQWDLIGELEYVTVTGRAERWEYVSAHFTKAAAEAFIKRKKHDYREGIRVYVEAQCYSWEYNAIKQAIMDGRLVMVEQTSEVAA